MDVHPPTNGINRYWSIAIWLHIITVLRSWTFGLLSWEASQLVEYRNIVSCIFRAAGNAAARPIQNDVLMEAMHAWMEIWTLSINCHPGACRSEQHCFSSWLTCSLCQSKLRNASISSCCWHDIQAWQIHPLCQIDISMYVYSYRCQSVLCDPSFCVWKFEALQTLFYDPTPFTRLRLRSPSPTPGGANCQGPRFTQLAFIQAMCLQRSYGTVKKNIYNNPRPFILAWPVLYIALPMHYRPRKR